ncbi:MAG: 50S ribosomal protein L6 [Candidatus Diapherotrites archaeon]|uniref:50S ribosomal protein L6 n=1 Tax=Candidatus Iainarchaeum sp. TaxID=3101447 RepID=A0A8T4KT16_9ARCH|nr:50S ribosomal protein L6 [Candidatus Diapherotrites archaeon]
MKKFEKIIELPENVSAQLQVKTLSLKCGNAASSREFKAAGIRLSLEGNKIIISSDKAGKKTDAVANTLEKHIKNMIQGFKEDYEYRLSVVYSHFPISVAVKQGLVEVNNFLGEKKPRRARILGITRVEVKGAEITVRGNSKEDAGQTAANLEQATRVSARDRRVFQDGIYITKKPG